MNLKATFEKKTFKFKQPSGTSRGVLTEKKAWFISIWDENNSTVKGIGECSIIPQLSPDYTDDESYEKQLQEVVDNVDYFAGFPARLFRFPSIRFGLETALLDLKNGGTRTYFDTPFTRGEKGIRINGLIWMGESDFMFRQIDEKLQQGFSCIKLKIGAIDFDKELALIDSIRKKHPRNEVEIRVDANGAFSMSDAEEKLKALSAYQIHSIEQPIAPKQYEAMRALSETELVPIALDEELIGVYDYDRKRKLMEEINPHYIILKPSLLGGFDEVDEWIKLAGNKNIPWWITSALESNIGLEAIAQYASTFALYLAQGLGTGSLYENNVDSQLAIEGEELVVKK